MSFLHLNLNTTSNSGTSASAAGSSGSILTKSGNDDQHNQQNNSAQHCYIHPVVLFSILDHYLRRSTTQENVIGTLLGVPGDDGRIIDVRSCFAVPHFENEEQVEMDMDYHHQMYQLHNRVNQREVIVGWYSTGSKLSKYAPLIHDFYTRQSEGKVTPIHIVLDTELTGNKLGLQAFTSAPVGTDKNPENCIFLPACYEIQYPNAERSALDLISKAKDNEQSLVPLMSDMDQLESAIVQLIEMLDRVSQYVEEVCDGKLASDHVVGKYLVDMLSYVPKIDTAHFESLFQTHLQDLLMTVYLTNLTRAQLNIADRLQRIV